MWIQESSASTRGSTKATPLFLGLLFTLLLGVQLVLYRDSFAVKPSSDDFVALHQVDRGEREGVRSFFMASDALDYRPLQNVTFWFFGRTSRKHVLLSLRILHILSSVFYAMVAFLWIRTLSFNRVGAVVAGCVAFLHPALAGALAGLDNYARLVVSAWVWLGAWIAYGRGTRPLLAIVLVSLCFAIALGYMEYAITLIPLAGLVTAWRDGRRSIRPAWVLSVSLMVIFSAYFMIRASVVVGSTPDAGHLSLDPRVWVKNTAMIAGAVLFFGNTVPIMEEDSLRSLAWLGSNVMLVALALGWGLWSGRRYRAGLPRHAVLLGAACAASCFPMVLMRHISEIYLSAVVLAVALLTGHSAHAWATASRPLRYLALVLAGSQLLLAANAIQSKVAGINGAGERTDAMMRSLLEHIPNDGATKSVAAVFLNQEGAENRRYSIFAMPDDELIPQGYGRLAIRWFRPDLNIRLDPLLVTDPAGVDFKSYDLVFVWDNPSQRFSLLEPSASRL